jgi:anthranilate synthase component 1
MPETPSAEDEACFLIFRRAVILDAASGRAVLAVNRFESSGNEPAVGFELQAMERALTAVPAPPSEAAGPAVERETSGLDPLAFQRAVRAVKKHIRQGDIFQCVLSQRLAYRQTTSNRELYRSLRSVSPAPYLYCFETERQTLVGASPELLIRVREGRVETCPIAGTRPRGENATVDAQRERQLRRSPKERAEHLMLVDLSRNDLGQVCQPGTVRVRDFMQVQRFSHVMHLVSLVEGELDSRHSALDALFAAFPAGTLTGAPKIRAMEIISRLEGRRRGAYGGAVVLYDFRGELDSCITIRSLVARGGEVVVQAGAGIVADSVASRELDEIRHKSRAARRALAHAEQGSKP